MRALQRYPRTALLLLVLIAYWPLSLGLAALKNDALLYFLPFRHALSESFAAGSLPLWAPSLFTGLPVHADMQSGMWNPVAMILAFFFRYNMTVLTAEVLLYLTIGAWGTYALGRHLRWPAPIAFAIAAAYSLQGFFGDSASFVPWVAAGAWLPWVLLHWKQTTEAPSLRPALKLALTAALLLTCGYPSFFIITGYGLFGLTLYLSFHRPYRLHLRAIWGYLALAGGVTTLITLPALISWYEFLPYYERGAGLALANALLNPFALKSVLSLAVPPAAYALDLNNDISSRNGSVALLLLPMVVLAARSGGRTQRTVAGLTLLSFLLSLGGLLPLRGWAWDFLPGWDAFRHPATLRLFTATGLLLLAGTGLHFEALRHKGGWLQRSERFLLFILAGLWLSAILRGGFADLQAAMEAAGGGGRAALKAFYSGATPAAWLIIGLPVQAVLLRWLAVRQRRGVPVPLLPPLIVQLILFSTLSFPYTLISQQRPGAVNAWIRDHAREERKAAAQQPLIWAREDSARTPLGYAPFYSRRVTLQDAFISPTIPTAYGALMKDTALLSRLHGSYLGATDGGSPVTVLTAMPNRFSFSTATPVPDTFRFRQQYHHHWTVTINNRPGDIVLSERALMAVVLPKGPVILKFTYQPRAVILSAWLAALLLLGLFIYLTFPLHVPKARH